MSFIVLSLLASSAEWSRKLAPFIAVVYDCGVVTSYLLHYSRLVCLVWATVWEIRIKNNCSDWMSDEGRWKHSYLWAYSQYAIEQSTVPALVDIRVHSVIVIIIQAHINQHMIPTKIILFSTHKMLILIALMVCVYAGRCYVIADDIGLWIRKEQSVQYLLSVDLNVHRGVKFKCLINMEVLISFMYTVQCVFLSTGTFTNSISKK